MTRSRARPLKPALEPNSAIAAYNKDIDCTLLREHLKRTAEKRLRRLMELQPFAEKLRHAGRSAHGLRRIAITGASINIVRFAFMAWGSTAHVSAARGQSAERWRQRA